MAKKKPSVVYRTGKPTYADYNEAIWALRDGCSQLEPDGRSCAVCHDGGHQAWECHHNPLVMARRFAGVTDVWKCFHCGVVFTDEDKAREHFGLREEEIARCLVEDAPGGPWEIARREDTDDSLGQWHVIRNQSHLEIDFLEQEEAIAVRDALNRPGDET